MAEARREPMAFEEVIGDKEYTPSLWKHEKIYLLDWQTLGVCLEKIKDQIISNAFHPTTIIGIARGGLVAATYFANAFGLRDLHVLGISRNTSNDRYSKKQAPELLWISPDTSLKGRSVLLVDDVVGEGSTLSLAVDLLKQKEASSIQTAVIVSQEKAFFKPDYQAVTLDDWIVFPWEQVKAGEEKSFEAVKI